MGKLEIERMTGKVKKSYSQLANISRDPYHAIHIMWYITCDIITRDRFTRDPFSSCQRWVFRHCLGQLATEGINRRKRGLLSFNPSQPTLKNVPSAPKRIKSYHHQQLFNNLIYIPCYRLSAHFYLTLKSNQNYLAISAFQPFRLAFFHRLTRAVF